MATRWLKVRRWDSRWRWGLNSHSARPKVTRCYSEKERRLAIAKAIHYLMVRRRLKARANATRWNWD